MSEDESGEGSASSADEDPVDQDEDSQADLNASMQEMNVQQVRIIASSVKPFKSKNRDKIYLNALNPILKKVCDRNFRATAQPMDYDVGLSGGKF